MSWEKREILLVVKTYPAKSKKHGDIVCTAGILEDTNEWIRIYPINWQMFQKKELNKYIRIKADILKDKSDYQNRKESYKIRQSSIEIIDDSLVHTKNKGVWNERRKIMENCLDESVESLHEQFTTDKTSLGMIKPKINNLKFHTIKPFQEIEIKVGESTQMTLDNEVLKQADEIEKAFKYKFKCNGLNCLGHNMICEDWEMLEAFRKYTNKYDPGEAEEKFRYKFYDEMILKRDLYFILGMHWQFPVFMIIGLFYPPKKKEQHQKSINLMDFIYNNKNF